MSDTRNDPHCLAGNHDTRRMDANEAYPATDGVACRRCGRHLLSWGVEWTSTPQRWTPKGVLAAADPHVTPNPHP